MYSDMYCSLIVFTVFSSLGNVEMETSIEGCILGMSACKTGECTNCKTETQERGKSKAVGHHEKSQTLYLNPQIIIKTIEMSKNKKSKV